MKFQRTGRSALVSRFVLLAALCLAIMLLLGAAAPAQADGQCENRAWMNVPIEGTLAALPHVGWTYNALYSVALAKDYALLGWRHEHIEQGIYYFAVGTFGVDSAGRKKINWNMADAYKLVTGGGVSAPAMAINDRGNVLIALQDGSEVSWMACKVTHTSTGHPILHCGKYHESAYEGTDPSVALNITASGEEQALLTYEGWLFYSLFYRFGHFNESSLDVSWGNHHHYSAGHTPSIAMNNLSEVVETHFTANPFSNHLYIKVGRLDSGSGHIHWGHSHVYESGGLPGQSVALVDRAVIEFHQGTNPYGDKIYYRYGAIDSAASKVAWQGGTGKHRIGGTMCQMPVAAVNNQGDLLMAFKDPPKGPLSYVFGGLGKLGYGYACPWPIVTTRAVSHVTETAAVSGGEVTIEGDGPATARGVCWSTSPNPTINDHHTNDGNRFGPFTSSLTGLSPDVTYHVRAYATNALGTGYGADLTFTTGKSPPVVHTLSPHFITTDTAWAGGAVTKEGEGPVTDRGLCWSTSANPTINNPSLSSDSGMGAYYDEIMGLQPDTTYHVRAYATNQGGTSYGADLSFITQHPSLPTVYSSDPLDMTDSSAVLGGDVTREGSGPVTERGVVWSTTPKPNLNNHRQAMGDGPGAFSGSVGGFSPETTYHVRAYAINGAGHTFGQDKMFATTAGTLPKVTTTAPYGETETSALSGGYVTNGGQSAVTARGVCWSTSPNPDTSGAHTEDGQGMGRFHSVISGLSPETDYYVRAYATNSAGTAYGEEYSFRTVHPNYPVVHTLAITELTTNSALVGGWVVTEGGGPVETRGICWATSPQPTVADNVVPGGSGLGQFQDLIGGLHPETVYYARAFATNQYGTSYGHIVHFRTTFCPYPCR